MEPGGHAYEYSRKHGTERTELQSLCRAIAAIHGAGADRGRVMYVRFIRETVTGYCIARHSWRMKDKTQVFLAPQGDHYRNRLTATLEVSDCAYDCGHYD